MRETRKKESKNRLNEHSIVEALNNTRTQTHSRKDEYFQAHVHAHSRPRTHQQSNIHIHNKSILVDKNFNTFYAFFLSTTNYDLYRGMSRGSTLDALPFLVSLLNLSRSTVTTAPSLTLNHHHGEFGNHNLEESESSSFFAHSCSPQLPFFPVLTSKLPFFRFVFKRYYSEVICEFCVQPFEIFTSIS